MSEPEKETPNVFRTAMTDDPKLEGFVMLMLDRLAPALEHAKDYGKILFPDDDDLTECVDWTNGAIFGTVAAFVTLNHDEAKLEEITKIYACISDIISETLDRYGRMNLEQYAQDFLVRVGAEKEASS